MGNTRKGFLMRLSVTTSMVGRELVRWTNSNSCTVAGRCGRALAGASMGRCPQTPRPRAPAGLPGGEAHPRRHPRRAQEARKVRIAASATAHARGIHDRGGIRSASWVHFREMHRRRNGGIRFFPRISRKCAHMKVVSCNWLRNAMRTVLLAGVLSAAALLRAGSFMPSVTG